MHMQTPPHTTELAKRERRNERPFRGEPPPHEPVPWRCCCARTPQQRRAHAAAPRQHEAALPRRAQPAQPPLDIALFAPASSQNHSRSCEKRAAPSKKHALLHIFCFACKQWCARGGALCQATATHWTAAALQRAQSRPRRSSAQTAAQTALQHQAHRHLSLHHHRRRSSRSHRPHAHSQRRHRQLARCPHATASCHTQWARALCLQ